MIEKMTPQLNVSHALEEAHANVVAICNHEWTHGASNLTHHNLHLHCHVCRVLHACRGPAYMSVKFRLYNMITYQGHGAPSHHSCGCEVGEW